MRLITAAWCWAVIIALGWVMIAWAVRQTRPARFTLLLQTLMPLSLLPAYVVCGLALWSADWPLVAASAVLVVAHVVLVVPAARGGVWPPWATTAATVRMLSANLYDANPCAALAAASVLAHRVDVLVLLEIGPDVDEALVAAGLDERFPYRVRSVARESDVIDGIYSRLPLREMGLIDAGTVLLPTATIEVSGELLRVVAVHVANPIRDVRAWRRDLQFLCDHARDDSTPLVMAGDFNANRWNPQFAALLDAGLRDAVETTGRGLTFSWPIGRFLPFPVMRLDHALGNGAVAALANGDVTIPGSDHRGLITTWAVATGGAGTG